MTESATSRRSSWPSTLWRTLRSLFSSKVWPSFPLEFLPRDRLLAVFDTLDEWFRRPDFRGCLFAKAAAEYPELADPIHRAATLHQREILGYLQSGGGGTARPWDGLREVRPDDVVDEEPQLNLATLERQAIQEALGRHGGNRRRAAEELGISERTLYRKIKEYGLV